MTNSTEKSLAASTASTAPEASIIPIAARERSADNVDTLETPDAADERTRLFAGRLPGLRVYRPSRFVASNWSRRPSASAAVVSPLCGLPT